MKNIYFMWISAKNTPKFRTINNFRSKHLKNEINTIFANVIALFMEIIGLEKSVRLVNMEEL
ncbi:transposase [Cetobacterium sp. 8H]|uniref:transposase n=1 Tax=Cetobacterium sp. 8H TaxID=2759681 RepID=UPI00351B6243